MGLPFENVKRRTIVLREEATDSGYGLNPKERSIEERLKTGFILLDKPPGIRSKTAAHIAKKILAPLDVTKIGYSGTLED